MTQAIEWEYFVLTVEGGHDFDTQNRLSKLGLEGWEIVGVCVQWTKHTIYMKRQRWVKRT